MQYTLRNVPRPLDAALRRRAREEGKSLNEVVLQVLKEALGFLTEPARHRDLGSVAGSWQEDPETDAVLSEQRLVDPDLW